MRHVLQMDHRLGIPCSPVQPTASTARETRTQAKAVFSSCASCSMHTSCMRAPADPGQQAVLQAHGLSQLGRPQLREHGLAEEHLPGPARRHCGWVNVMWELGEAQNSLAC